MTEKEPTEPISLDKVRGKRRRGTGVKSWAIDQVAEHLRSQVAPLEDAEYGQGHLLLVGLDHPVVGLELFPSAAAARIYTQELSLELSPISPPKLPLELSPVDAESLLLESPSVPTLRLTLTAEGAISLFIKGSQELPQYRLSPAPPAELRDGRADHSAAPEATSPVAAKEREQQQRVTLEGRVGAEPAFRTTKQNKLVARFPLAVHEKDETTWHQVVVFGDRAKQLQESLKKGQAVEIVAYVHHNERQSRDGSKRVVEELYAVAVRKPEGFPDR